MSISQPFHDQSRQLVWPDRSRMTSADFIEARHQYDQAQLVIDAEFAQALAEEYFSGEILTHADVLSRVYSQAYSSGHSSGFFEIESDYQDLAEIVQVAFDAGLAAR